MADLLLLGLLEGGELTRGDDEEGFLDVFRLALIWADLLLLGCCYCWVWAKKKRGQPTNRAWRPSHTYAYSL